MARYGFATVFDAPPSNYEFTPGNIPLHLTHVDSFEIALTAEDLAAKLAQALAGQPIVKVTATEDKMLGPNKDIPATMLALTPELAELHAKIMDMLEAEGAILKNPQFHRESYGPHISIYGNRRARIGEAVTIKDISIGTKSGEGPTAIHRLVAHVDLVA